MNEQIEIVLYLPVGNREITEPESQWLNGFQKIFKVAIEQFLSKEILFKQVFNIQDIPIQSKKSTIIQVILNENIDFSSCIQRKNDNKYNELNIIQLVCFQGKDRDFNFKDKKSINFYEENNGRVVHLEENQIHKIKDEIWLKLFDIALEVKNILFKYNRISDNVQNQKSVYLAQTSPDQNQNRNIIEREIKHLGYNILSPPPSFTGLEEYKSEVSNYIENSIISIHLIGNNYLPLVPDSNISVVEFQNNIFTGLVEKNQNRNHYRLVFMAPELKPKSEKQKQYIENFTHNIDALKNTEIIQAPIEIFKSIIKKKLVEINPAEEISTTKSKEINGIRSTYLIYNDSDKSTAEEIKKQIQSKGIRILDIDSSLSSIEQIRNHRNNLIECDSVFVLSLDSNKQWLTSKISDILKSPGIGRKRKFVNKIIYKNADTRIDLLKNIKDITVFDHKVSIKDNLQAIIEILK